MANYYLNYLNDCGNNLPLPVTNYLYSRGVEYPQKYNIKYSVGLLKKPNYPWDIFNNGIDKFTGYILIPVFDEYAEVVGIIGRNFFKNNLPKYMLSLSEHFVEKGHIYGLDRVLPHVMNKDIKPVILTEGWFDWLVLTRVYKHVLCTFTCNVNQRQQAVLKRYFDKFYIAFDNDEEKYGLKAAQYLSRRLNAEIRLPQFKDWNQMYTSLGSAKFDEEIKKIFV